MNSKMAKKAAPALALGLILGLAVAPQVTFAQDHGHHSRGGNGGGSNNSSSNSGGYQGGGGSSNTDRGNNSDWRRGNGSSDGGHRDSGNNGGGHRDSGSAAAVHATSGAAGGGGGGNNGGTSGHPWYGANNHEALHGQNNYHPSGGSGGDSSYRGRDDHRGNDHRDWNDHRGNDRGRFDWHSDSHFRNYSGVRLGFYFAPDRGYYRVPDQWYGHRWARGEYLPSFFFSDRVDDPDYYDLPYPPYGCAWYLVGEDAVLIDVDSGEIVDVIYGVY